MLKALFPFFSRNSVHQTSIKSAFFYAILLSITTLSILPGSASAIITDERDVSLELTATPAVNGGGNMVYIIKVTQLEADTLANITVSDFLPGDSEVISAVTANGSCFINAANVAICKVSLALNSPATIRIEAKPMSSGQLVNRVVLTGVDVDDPDPIHLTAQAITRVSAFSTLSASLNGLAFRTGSTLKMNAKLTTFGLAGTLVDVWFTSVDAAGNIFYFAQGRWSPLPVPAVTGWAVSNWPSGGSNIEGLLYTHTFNGEEDIPGFSSLSLYLTETGTMNLIGNKVTVPFFFTR